MTTPYPAPRLRAPAYHGPHLGATRTRATSVAVSVVAVAVLGAIPLARAAYRAPFVARHYAAATDNPDATRAAVAVLAAGGNAADAAIAAALALGVVSPASSGLGGGGFATICDGHGQCSFVDFRETAPAALTLERLRATSDPAHASAVGPLAVAVPGEPSGLALIARRFGHLPLATVVAPATRLARGGFEVSESLASRIAHDRENLSHDAWLSNLLVPRGTPRAAGSRMRRPVLAATIERWARGPEAFIGHVLAPAIARTMARIGGVVAADEVRAYRPLERRPLVRAFREYSVVTAPPPSAGGIILLETLAWHASFGASAPRNASSAYWHWLAESFRQGFDDRARYVADPGASPAVDGSDAILAPARLARRRASFDPARTRPLVVVDPPRDNGTTHVCVMDSSGMTVSLSTTVNLAFGARVALPELDVVLNDEVDDFALTFNGTNFGLRAPGTNALAPGRRPVSSMTPTVVLRNGRPVGCIGASGGPMIATATTQVFLNLAVHGLDPEAAVSAPRIHHQGGPNRLSVDREIAEDVRVALTARGHEVADFPEGRFGVAQAIWVRESGGVREILAAADPRKRGLALGR